MEVYKSIFNYPQYLVSNLGNVKSLRYNRPLKGSLNSCGYLRVQLGKSNNKHFIHRLVADQFCKKTKNKDKVNHKNGIKTDNRSTNLEWCSASENDKHAFRNKLKISIKGEKHYNAKLTEKNVIEIKKCLNIENCTKLAERFLVHRKTISDIKNHKTWKHVQL